MVKPWNETDHNWFHTRYLENVTICAHDTLHNFVLYKDNFMQISNNIFNDKIHANMHLSCNWDANMWTVTWWSNSLIYVMLRIFISKNLIHSLVFLKVKETLSWSCFVYMCIYSRVDYQHYFTLNYKLKVDQSIKELFNFHVYKTSLHS